MYQVSNNQIKWHSVKVTFGGRNRLVGSVEGTWARTDYPGPELVSFQAKHEGRGITVTAHFTGNTAFIVARTRTLFMAKFKAQQFFNVNFAEKNC